MDSINGPYLIKSTTIEFIRRFSTQNKIQIVGKIASVIMAWDLLELSVTYAKFHIESLAII